MPRFRRVVAAAIGALLASSVCEAKQESWIEVRSPNFVVVSNAGEKQARKAALQFEQIRAVFRQSLQNVNKHPSPVVTVLAVKDEGSMRELLPEYWTKGHSHPAGLFAGSLIQLYAAVELDAQGSNPYEAFYHEYYHSISVPYVPDLPLWLSEGLAEFYGHTEINEKFVGMGQADPALLQELRNHSLIPLTLLFNVDQYSPYYNEANKTSIFYAESWALTHYLMLGDRMAHRDMLDAYTTTLGHGKREDEAAIAAFGDLKKLQSDLQSYIGKASFLYLKMPSAKINEGELKVRSLSEAEAEAYRGGFAAVRNRPQDATALLEAALRLDPNVALAHQYLGLTEFIEGQREKALEAESKAIALDPRNSFTRYLRAFLATSGSGMMNAGSQVEEDLRQAIAISPDFAPPYGLLAVYLATVNRSLQEALALAQKAAAFEPASSNYQLALAQVLARMNKLDDADLAAAKARAWARDPAEKANAESFKAYLQQARQYQSQFSAPNPTHSETLKVGEIQGNSSQIGGSPASKGLTGNAATAVQMQASISILSDPLGVDFTPYLKDIMDVVRKNLTSSVTKGFVAQQRSLSVEFVILKEGKIAGLKLSSSSGDTALDHATLDGIAASSPFPALPIQFKAQALQLHFGLTYSPESPH